jgi:hypothetical protein
MSRSCLAVPRGGADASWNVQADFYATSGGEEAMAVATAEGYLFRSGSTELLQGP